MRKFIDFNVDIGEGFANEAKIIPLVSSVNIACGAHAGDKDIMRYVLRLSKSNNIRVGAHPSFPDKINFGRIPLGIPINELRISLISQLELLKEVALEENVEINYIKPHGALYHLACYHKEYAKLLIDLAGEDLQIMGLPNSFLHNQCKFMGVNFISEGFSDRVYESDGRLRKRSLRNSVIFEKPKVLKQVLGLCRGEVVSYAGDNIPLNIDSVCFHSDHIGADELIKEVLGEIRKKGIEIRS